MILTFGVALISHAFLLVRWRTLAYRIVPEEDWERLRRNQLIAGLDDTSDWLGLQRRFTRDQDDKVSVEIIDHLSDLDEIERVNIDFLEGGVHLFNVHRERIIGIIVIKTYLVALGVICVIVNDELWVKLFYFVIVIAAVRIYPNYPHWKYFRHGGVGFEINETCFGSIRPEKRIIYWRDVKMYKLENRGWRCFLIVELRSGSVQEFDLGLYRLGSIDYFYNLMKVYSSRFLNSE
ncbi:MAG: hypothetical protein AB8H12_05680 [Lewinella sp.]